MLLVCRFDGYKWGNFSPYRLPVRHLSGPTKKNPALMFFLNFARGQTAILCRKYIFKTSIYIIDILGTIFSACFVCLTKSSNKQIVDVRVLTETICTWEINTGIFRLNNVCAHILPLRLLLICLWWLCLNSNDNLFALCMQIYRWNI